MFRKIRGWFGNKKHSNSEGVPSGVLRKPPGNLDISFTSDKWEETEAEVEKIYIYPMKSTRGIKFKSATCGPYCLSNKVIFDRQFIIVESSHHGRKQKARSVNARMYHKLVLLKSDVIQPDEDKPDVKMLKLTAPDSMGMKELCVKLPKNPKDPKLTETMIFRFKCKGIDLGDAAADWISDYIQKSHHTSKGFRILYHPYSPGKFEENYYDKKEENIDVLPQTKPDDIPLFSDGYPVMLMAQKSLDELNRRLKARKKNLVVEERRFRPNILIKNTAEAFEEDNWLYLRIGDAVFRNAKLCTRCVMTLIDPDTGEENGDREPLKTLKTFRVSQDERELALYYAVPFLGINLALENYDKNCDRVIRKGDKVWVIRQEKKK